MKSILHGLLVASLGIGAAICSNTAEAQTSWDIDSVFFARIGRPDLAPERKAPEKQPAKKEVQADTTLDTVKEWNNFLKEISSKESSLVSVSVVLKKAENEEEAKSTLYFMDWEKPIGDDFTTVGNIVTISRSEGFEKMLDQLKGQIYELSQITLIEKGDAPLLTYTVNMKKPEPRKVPVYEEPSYHRRGSMILE